MTTDLVMWLRQQLDDDGRLIDEYERYMGERGATAGSFVLVTPPGWQTGEPFDTARMLAEVDAKRRIVELHQPYGQKQVMARGEIWACSECGSVDDSPTEWPCDTILLLALPYADRPGYDESWRP